MASDELLRRELDEIRAREAGYRDGLQRHLTLTNRLRDFTSKLMTALRTTAILPIDHAFSQAAAVSSEALGVERTSVWMVDRERGILACRQLLIHGQTTADRPELLLSSIPTYLAALDRDVTAVDDVVTDPRTRELAGYCATKQIGALLDIPIYLDGALAGVVCHEHIGGPRVWADAECEFATNIGNLVTIALETKRRQVAQAQAHELEARYRHLVETVPVVIYSFDTSTGELAYVSPSVEALSGRSADSILETGIEAWLELVHEGDRAMIRDRLRAGVGVSLQPEITYRITRTDGRLVWVRDLCAVVRESSGLPLAVQGTLEDITVERLAQEQLREADRRYRQLIEHVDLIEVVVDRNDTIVEVNPCFERTTGVARADAVGRRFDELVPPDYVPAHREFVEHVLATGEPPQRRECALRGPDGEVRPILWTSTIVRDATGAAIGLAGLGLDLTERVRLEAEVAEERKLDSLGRMAASVAHDFNNVLTVLSLALSSSLDEPGINAAFEHARELVASLLGYARRQPVGPTTVDVDATIAELRPVLATAAGSDLELDVELHATGRQVWISQTEVRQLVLNLVTNAAEATRGHGHAIRVSTSVAMSERAALQLELHVADDGRGMDRATLDHAFDPFFTTKPVGSGTGIGLATCRAIVSRAGGTITADSAVGRGTTFRVTLPILAQPDAQPATDEPRILLAEDNYTLATMIARALVEAGYQVESVASVAMATAALARTRFGIIVTDVNLVDGNAQAIVAAARAADPNVAIVSVSGDRGGLADVDASITKPFTYEELLAAIKQAVAKRQPRDLPPSRRS